LRYDEMMNGVKSKVCAPSAVISQGASAQRRGGRWWGGAAVFLALYGAAGCTKTKGASELTSTLPSLVLRDDTTDLLLTWLDEKGEFHTVQHIQAVPPNHADTVRIVVTSQDDSAVSSLIYVADLRNKQSDGSYLTHTMLRSEWESRAEKRRNPTGDRKINDKLPGATGTPGSNSAEANANDVVIVYGASWCGPCHQATDELRRRGIPFVYKDIEQQPNAADEMQRKLSKAGMPAGSIPVIDVRGRLLIGYDRRALDAALASTPHGSAPL